MAFTSQTDADHSYWWLIGSSVDGNNRLSDVIDDQPDGPYLRIPAQATYDWRIYGTNKWYDYSRTDQPLTVLDDGVALTKVADNTQSSLALGQWCWDTSYSRVYLRLSDDSDPSLSVISFTYWTAGSGSEYYYSAAKYPDKVFDDAVILSEVANDSQGTLSAGQWCWDTVNSRVYVHLSDSSNPDNSGMDQCFDWWGGNAGTDFLDEIVEDKYYHVGLHLIIGDDVTTTVLVSKLEIVYAASMAIGGFGAKLILGESSGDYGTNGMALFLYNQTSSFGGYYSSFEMYDSKIVMLTNNDFNALYLASWVCIRSSFVGGGNASGDGSIIIGAFSTTVEDINITNWKSASLAPQSAGIIRYKRVKIDSTYQGIKTTTTCNVREPHITNTVASADYYTSMGSLTVTNPVTWDWDRVGAAWTLWVYLFFSVDIKVIDNDGPIQGATVVIKKEDGTVVNTDTTDANGVMPSVDIETSRKTWLVFGAVVVYPYGPFDIIVSKDGYETKIFYDIDIEGDCKPIDWTIKLEPARGEPVAVAVELSGLVAVAVEIEEGVDITVDMDD